MEAVLEQRHINMDKDAGLNSYIGLTSDSDTDLIRSNGMTSFVQQDEWLGRPDVFDGWALYDEVDMIEGPSTGYASMDRIVSRLPQDGKPRYNNYGKGVTFWETDAEASRFVNTYTNIVSADNYWFTDPNICGQYEGGKLVNGATAQVSVADCRRAYNYGLTIDRMRYLDGLDGTRQRVWAFVEDGHPFTESSAPSIQPAQMRAAVWQSIIAGAQGLIYFNHSFGGPCQSQHVLRDSCYAAIRAEAKRTNTQIASLARVLNAPFADGLVTASNGVRAMAKYSGGQFYVFAGSRTTSPQTATFNIGCTGDATVTVVDENRTIPLSNGSFSDSYADGNAVHIYRIDGGSTCGLPQ